jgi:membrane fusion protein, multidrug efflux system
VNIVYDRRPDTLQLPRTALIDADGEKSVYIVANGKAEQRKVRTGLENGGYVEVLEGLAGNENIVVVGQAGLKSGTPVKIVGDEQPPKGVVPAGQTKAK